MSSPTSKDPITECTIKEETDSQTQSEPGTLETLSPMKQPITNENQDSNYSVQSTPQRSQDSSTSTENQSNTTQTTLQSPMNKYLDMESSITSPIPTSPDPQDLTLFVRNLLEQMQTKFDTMGDSIIGRIDEVGSRIDELEKNIGDLMKEADVNLEDANLPALSDDVQTNDEIETTSKNNDVDAIEH